MKTNTVVFDADGAMSKMPGKWLKNLFIPEALAAEVGPWLEFSKSFATLFPDQRFAITSVYSVISGKLRAKTSSHYAGWSLDIGPIFSPELIKPDQTSPHLADNRRLAAFLAGVDLPIATFLEGDHFHFDLRFQKGVYLSSTYRKSYKDDVANWDVLSSLPTTNQPMRVYKDGSIVPVNLATVRIPNAKPIDAPSSVIKKMKDPNILTTPN